MTPEQVLTAVDAVMSRPFEWGVCDCCTAACDVFLRLWGVDPMADVRSQYMGLRGAAALIRENGGFPALVESVLAPIGLTPGHQIGGLAMTLEGRGSLLICIQPGQWAGKTLNGFALVSRADRGWHLA
ncbi:hypothetical protein D2T31_05005 [Sinirhodobacter populi]|uniref:DUF6950 domain-containing protein n=1 Tax=Paenirhodobacter populi TaxID=2306993 RepID=A0A443KEZ7_9RHOB|nr:hypothetical protein [Sinirhodobacter populi]RWR31360.1 hypothetical protein D2T31_05005 [Sinirhodobacter populi]